MNKILEFAGLALLCQVMAPLMVLNLPSLKRLKVTSVHVRERGMFADNWGTYSHEYVPSGTPPVLKETPRQLIIRGHGDRKWCMAIDLEDGTIGHADWPSLTFYEHQGSAGIGIMLFGLPALLVTSPLWITTNFVSYLVAKLTPLDVETWAIWIKIRGQLSKENREIVWDAIQKHRYGVENSHNIKRAKEYDAKVKLMMRERDAIYEGDV